MDGTRKSWAKFFSDIFHKKAAGPGIFLLETHVAGLGHIPHIDEIEPTLHVGDKLRLSREPENQHDEMAIVVKTAKGVKIGYVPRSSNAVFARLMDGGKQLGAKISGKSGQPGYHYVLIKIYLTD
ncbi:MAG: HIRAN domain-containing protein [Deltaproteobacteria bacterium]|jgi:hypothetical protein|nr:HIRAN domain-containing protein [Deltaproteobacteria bacterium]